MESARGYDEINVRNTSDHIADFDSGRRMVCVRERESPADPPLYSLARVTKVKKYLHVTRHTTQ